MPIYAYRCETCGFTKDVLQKVSDVLLTDCLSCGKSTFRKQLTAAGFQLKGSGWYVTDFRGGASPAAAPDAAATPAAGSGAAPAASATTATTAATTTTTTAAAPVTTGGRTGTGGGASTA